MQPETTIVIGAGIIGLCIGLSLLRAGRTVEILEMSQPGSGASFGNSGLISVDTALPMAVPGMLRQVPGWLADPTGPVAVRPSYLATVAPWLGRWVYAGRMNRVLASADALRALHKDAFDGYRELLGPHLFSDLIRTSGVVQLWETEGESRSDVVARQLREIHGVQSELLTSETLREIFPGISLAVKRGILLPRNGYTVSPARLTKTLSEIFAQAGGTIRCERVLKLVPHDAVGFGLITNVGYRQAHSVVLAAGAWTKSLLEPLRIRLPLEPERGYHLLLGDCSLDLPMPIMHRGRGFGFTPMEDGMCLAGTVEFAGLDAPPSERRALILRELGKKIFPGLEGTIRRIWMGFRPSLPDSVPAIGRAPGYHGLYLAAGHGHYGMVGAPATARLIVDTLLDRSPSIDPRPYSADRF